MGFFSTNNHYHTKTVNVPYEKSVTVNEYKASTDKSIKLLNEMQEKAKENIIHTIKIEENYLKAVAIYYRDLLIIDRMEFYLKFELNGLEFCIKDHIDKREWRKAVLTGYTGLGNEYIFRVLHKKFSEMIAEELMKQSPDFLSSIKP